MLSTTTSGGGVIVGHLRRRLMQMQMQQAPVVARRRCRRRVGGGGTVTVTCGAGARVCVGQPPLLLVYSVVIFAILSAYLPTAGGRPPPAFATSPAFRAPSCPSSSSSPLSFLGGVAAFLPPHGPHQWGTVGSALSMSYVADSSDYSGGKSSDDSSSDTESSDASSGEGGGYGPGYSEMADVPTVEESPTPLSKNAGMRFVAFVWDRLLDVEGRDREELHDHRCRLVEDHVLWARRANLYNETWNWESSNADVVWSYPLLSADKRHQIGHAMCIDSNSIEHVRDLLSSEPIIRSLTSGLGDLSDVHVYRWMHIKDHSLRQDDGRTGTPTLILNFDRTDPEADFVGLRESTNVSHVEYLIESERVVMAGPLHDVAMSDDTDELLGPPVGSIVVINAEDREDAIDFAENDPCALAGLYGTIRVHHFNDLDVSGKFVLRDEFEGEGTTSDDPVRDLMEAEGYPVGDRQTPWINR